MNTDIVEKDYMVERDFGIGSDIRDDFHTMSELYFNRMVLFSVLCNLVNEKYDNDEIYTWKSFSHHPEDGPIPVGYFIVGINTPEGVYCYHYNIKYQHYFENCRTLQHSPKYDGHRSSDIGRLYSILNK